MSHPRVVHEETKEKGTRFTATYLEVKNAGLILLSEGEDQLGTLAVAVPPAGEKLGPPLSSLLLGDRNITLARLLAERLAGNTKKIALVSVFIKTMGETEAGPILLKLAEKTLRKEVAE